MGAYLEEDAALVIVIPATNYLHLTARGVNCYFIVLLVLLMQCLY